MLFCFVAVPPTQGHLRSFTPKKETLAGPVHGAPFGALWPLLGGLVQSRVNGSLWSPGAGATILSSTIPHLSPSPRHLCPRRARVQPSSSSPPPQGTAHPSALPFPWLLPFGKSRTFSSPKRLFPAGTLAPWSCPKLWPCLWPLQQHGELLCLQSCSCCTPISKTSPHPRWCPQLQISQNPPWPQDTPTPHQCPVASWGSQVGDRQW